MITDAVLQKRKLRQELRAAVKGISVEQRLEWSGAACALLREQQVWQAARSVLLYAPLDDELDLRPLAREALAAGKTVALPRYLPESRSYAASEVRDLIQDCAPGSFGIIEPAADCANIPMNHLDLVIVPGVGFDSQGYRLGRGRGYYDRLLAEVTGVKCGVAFEQQMTGQLPTESHDVRMDCILTPSRWLEITRSNHII